MYLILCSGTGSEITGGGVTSQRKYGRKVRGLDLWLALAAAPVDGLLACNAFYQLGLVQVSVRLMLQPLPLFAFCLRHKCVQTRVALCLNQHHTISYTNTKHSKGQ